MDRPRNVLIVEDVGTLAQTYLSYLRTEQVDAKAVGTAAAAEAALAAGDVDVLVLDINLPDGNGLDLLRKIKSARAATDVIVVTAQGSVNLAVEAMRLGASDFLVKPLAADRLRVTLRNALERRRLAKTVVTLKAEFGRDRFCGFIGRSLAMQSIYRIVQSAARSKATVMITGESGTGKEVCAEAVHELSGRAGKPLVAINCAAIPRDLLESEIFGHMKGAFTGATSDRQGAAMMADGGTLFLDEVCELELSFQAKLLRFLQTGVVQRVGCERTHPVDVRIICATNRDPRQEVVAGRFREDLFFRLHVIPVEMPALRQREDDVLIIAREFLQRFAAEDGKDFTGFAPEVEAALLGYSWPGNVRELQNLVRKIVVLNEGPLVSLDMLPSELRCQNVAAVAAPVSSVDPASAVLPLDLVIDRAIDAAMQRFDGSIPKAAAALQISPSTIYRRLQSKIERLAG